MSNLLAEIKGHKEVKGLYPTKRYTSIMDITDFFGGEQFGPMLQLTLESGSYIQFDYSEVEVFETILSKWLNEH